MNEIDPNSELGRAIAHQEILTQQRPQDFVDAGPVFAKYAKVYQGIVDDDAFWEQREKLLAEQEAEEQRKREAVRDELRMRQLETLPAIYREAFDPKQARYELDIVRGVRSWEPTGGKGIGLVGTTGLGKTRLLTARLRNLACSWIYLPASRLNDLVADEWSENFRRADEARCTLRDARAVRVLMLDDVGDEKTTDAVSEELKDLIETRTSRNRPILWTSNLTEDQITKRHGTRGAAIVRRLAEFSWTP